MLAEVRAAITPLADPAQAVAMAAYLRDHFDFLGIRAKPLRAAAMPIVRAHRPADAAEAIAVADSLWAEPYREYRYVAMDYLRRYGSHLDADSLDDVRRYLVTDSWWDTVDLLACHVVGGLVTRHPEHVEAMDRWIDDDNIWLVRSAILHQLNYGAEVDEERLFEYALRRSGDTEFFTRKAIGWSLRDYARREPDSVRAFVTGNQDRLSGLTRREALKHL